MKLTKNLHLQFKFKTSMCRQNMELIYTTKTPKNKWNVHHFVIKNIHYF